MADISKCDGTNCPLKEDCFRFKVKADDYQSYLVGVPFKDGKCEYFMKLLKNKPYGNKQKTKV
jgi:hypothetical protein